MAEFTFSDEQNQLRASVRKFCSENFDEQSVRRLMESDPPFDPKVWTRLGSELGVLGLSVPEADGGVGGTLVDQAVAVEELGASLACGPVFGTVFLAIPALVAASSGQVRDELLAELVEGRRTAAFVVADRAGTLGAATQGANPPKSPSRRMAMHSPGPSSGSSTQAPPMTCSSPREVRMVWPCTPSTPRGRGWNAVRWSRWT